MIKNDRGIWLAPGKTKKLNSFASSREHSIVLFSRTGNSSMEHESSCCENSFSLATSLHFPHHILPHCPRNAFDELQNFSQINCLFSFQCKSITLHEEDSPSLILRVRCGPHYLQPKISSYSVLI